MSGLRISSQFVDREDAGRQLAQLLSRFQERRPVVLGMARGGVPVAAVVARHLGAPLDVLIVRKIGAPQHPEYAIGAIAGDILRIDEDTVRRLGIPRAAIDRIIASETREMVRRETLYRHGRAAVDVRDRTVIVIDDGLATGLSARVAMEAVRRRGPREILFAAPVCAPGGADRLGVSDEQVICALNPPDFYAVGAYYEDFAPTEDEEVIALLDEADRRARV